MGITLIKAFFFFFPSSLSLLTQFYLKSLCLSHDFPITIAFNLPHVLRRHFLSLYNQLLIKSFLSYNLILSFPFYSSSIFKIILKVGLCHQLSPEN